MSPALTLQLDAELATLAAHHRLRSLPHLSGLSRTSVDAPDGPLVSFCSNDYLGLASRPELRLAADHAAARSGFGASASRVVSGDLPEHRDLEAALAELLGFEEALLFPSGYQANLAILTALAGPTDLIVADRAIHASLIDGCRLSRAKLAFYPHLDLDRAAHHLHRLGPGARRRLLVTESVFSMDGDSAPLPDLAHLAAQHGAALFVDEAHAVGTLGPRGAGLCRAAGVRPDVLVATLGKALGAAGAVVTGPPPLRTYLLTAARPFLFTTAPPAPVAAAALAALRIATSSEGDLLRSLLRRNLARLLASFPPSTAAPDVPILPVILGSAEQALDAAKHLRSRGYLVPAIRPPTVRPGSSRLRLTASAAHTLDQIDGLLAAFPHPLQTTPPPPPSTRPLTFRSAPLPGLLLVGTDTAVGKTTVARALLRLLARRGLPVVPFKPVETGCADGPRDAVQLRLASRRADIPLDVVCPFQSAPPVAPAAALPNLALPALVAAAEQAAAYGSPILVETAGGLLTPYAPGLSAADLALALQLPVLLVARDALGTINHTALALAEIRRRAIPLAGLVLVRTTAASSPDHDTNATLIEQHALLRPLGTLPFLADATDDSLADLLAASVALEALDRWLT